MPQIRLTNCRHFALYRFIYLLIYLLNEKQPISPALISIVLDFIQPQHLPYDDLIRLVHVCSVVNVITSCINFLSYCNHSVYDYTFNVFTISSIYWLFLVFLHSYSFLLAGVILKYF